MGFLKFIFLISIFINNVGLYAAVNGYFGYAIGSPRVVAVGGAYTAVPEGVDAILYNPAGIGASKEKFILGSASSDLESRDINLDAENYGTATSTERDKVKQDYSFYALAMQNNWFSIGALYGPLYNSALEVNFGDMKYSYKVSVTNFMVPLAVGFWQNWYLGLEGIIYLGTQRRFFQAGEDQDPETKTYSATAKSGSIGLLYVNGPWRIGANYQAGAKIKFSNKETYEYQSTNSSVSFTTVYFDDIIVPPVMLVGMSYQAKYFLASIDGHAIFNKKNTGYMWGTGSASLSVKEKTTYTAHIGLEVPVFRKNIIARSGYYFEQARFVAGIDRHHYTLGLGLNYWKVTSDIAYDKAKDFESLVFASGFSF